MTTHSLSRLRNLHFTAFLLGCLLITGFRSTSFALTFEEDVTPVYVRAHPEEWSVKSEQKEDGLIHFTIIRKLAEPKYLVAQLSVHHAGKLIATSDTPLYGKARDNTFHFALTAEDIATSTFHISESGLSTTTDGQSVPIVGSIIHRFQLKDFLPESPAKPVSGK